MGVIKTGKFFQITLVGEIPMEMIGQGLTDEQMAGVISSGVAVNLTTAALLIGSETVFVATNPLAGKGGN